MHIPDGFLNSGTSASLISAAIGAIVYAASRVRKKFFVKQKSPTLVTPEGAEFGGSAITKLTKYGREKIFKMASVGAFIFAVQMLNFPVAQGTSGHFLGGVLATILLGPLEGLLVMAIVLIIQSLFFADGGLIALGANVFNMGIIGAVGGYYFYEFLRMRIKKIWLAAFIATWLSVVIASAACAIELALSNTIPFKTVLPAMMSVHALIGLGEGVITIVVLKAMKFKEKNE